MITTFKYGVKDVQSSNATSKTFQAPLATSNGATVVMAMGPLGKVGVHKYLWVVDYTTSYEARNIILTTEDMAESPLISMQVFGDQLLGRGLPWHVLSKNKYDIVSAYKLIT